VLEAYHSQRDLLARRCTSTSASVASASVAAYGATASLRNSPKVLKLAVAKLETAEEPSLASQGNGLGPLASGCAKAAVKAVEAATQAVVSDYVDLFQEADQ
jgi:hypothetical protein